MQTMILTSQDQLKNLDNVGAVLIYPSKITTSGLIQSATSNDLVVNCIVDDDPDNAFIGQSLSQLGYPSGCYIAINYQNKKTAKEITDAFSSNLQLGYRAAIIINKSDYTQDDFKAFSQYGIIVIDHNDVKNHILTVPEFLTSRSLAMIRDYTNVDISNVGPGAFVGVGKDTSGLGGGRSFGYSTNGQDFYAVITPKGLVFRQIDALRMWRLLKPQQAAQIGDFFNNKVAKEIEAQNESLKSAVATANSAVNTANQAVNDSKVNSDAIKVMQSAASEAKAGADKAISDAQAAIKNVASDTEAIRQNVASVAGQVNSAQAANDSQAKAMQTDLDKAKQSILDISKNLDKVSANLDTYAKSAAEQGHDITELKNQQGLIEADLASANGNVTQLQATVNGLQGNLKDTDSDVASLSATASQAGLALKNAQSQVAQVIARADKFQATIAEQGKKIVDIKATADSASVAASNANSTATEAKLTASEAGIVASNAKSDVLTVTANASDAKMLATNANSQAMEANMAASNVSIHLSGVEKTANNAASQASVATSKADQAGSNANKAQETANQANSSASKAQATADNNAKQISNVANTVTTVQTSIQATQKELSGKVDQATIDSTNKKLEDINAQVSVVAGEVRSKAEQTTVSGISTDLNDLKAKAELIEKDDIDFNDCKSQMNIFSKGPKNAPNDNYWWYLRVEPGTESRVTQYAVSDRDNHHYTRQFISTSWTPWKETADSNDVANLQAQVDKHSTEISNNTKEIQLKADSQTVNTINQTVQQQQAQQKIFADQITSKVSSADVEKMVDGKGFATKDLVESSITQASGKINETITNLQGNLQNVTADLTGLQSTVKDKADQSQITQLTNIVQSKVSSEDYQTTISQLTNDINAKVAKGDLISQINMEAGQMLIQSNKLFLDADSVVFSGKAFIPDAAIENLSLDKLTTGHITIPLTDKFGNKIELGREGIEISSAFSTGDDGSDSSTSSNDSSQKDKSAFKLRLSSNGVTFANQIEYGDTSKHIHKSDEYQFINLRPDILHETNGSSDDFRTPSGMTMYVPVNYSSDLGPSSPGGFFALGHENTTEGSGTDKAVDIAYVTRAINDWQQGFHVNTTMYMKPSGASHGMRTAWVSWSGWDNGERYPAFINGNTMLGGIAFPASGKITLFDPYGHTFWLTDQNSNYYSQKTHTKDWGDNY